tara:strand:+ start:229 stop:384 length:156 start_codon:yes stop_codon:yes gene_type:complete
MLTPFGGSLILYPVFSLLARIVGMPSRPNVKDPTEQTAGSQPKAGCEEEEE